jgi:hypothetical protein
VLYVNVFLGPSSRSPYFPKRGRDTYVGGDIDVYKETIEHDRLSFPVVKGIAKIYGYKSGDLIYYLLSSSTLRNGLKLITSNFDVHEMDGSSPLRSTNY